AAQSLSFTRSAVANYYLGSDNPSNLTSAFFELSVLFNVAFTSAELAALTANPWQLFVPPARKIWVQGTSSAAPSDGLIVSPRGRPGLRLGTPFSRLRGFYNDTGAALTTNITGSVGAYSWAGTTATASGLING